MGTLNKVDQKWMDQIREAASDGKLELTSWEGDFLDSIENSLDEGRAVWLKLDFSVGSWHDAGYQTKNGG